MRIRALVGATGVMALAAACSGSNPVNASGAHLVEVHPASARIAREYSTSRGPRPNPPTSLRASAAALAGHGELAVVSASRLWLIGGPVKKLRQVSLPGTASDPIWSPGGHWLAVRTRPAPPKSSPYKTEKATLWLVSPGGHVIRRLTPRGLDTTAAEWSPTADRLVVATSTDGSGKAAERVVVRGIRGHADTLAVCSYVGGVSWSPGGGRVAVSVNGFRGHWRSRLRVYPAHGGPGRTVTRAAGTNGNTLDLAGWWPDGSGLLAWRDPQGSGSVAADGLPLLEIPLATGKPHRLAKIMLVHSSWIAESKSRDTIAVIEGGDRELTLGPKTLALCTTSSCAPVPQLKKRASFDPGFSPSGRISVVRDRAVTPSNGFGASYVMRIERSGGADFLRRAKAARITRLGNDVTSPLWGSHGSLLAIRGRNLVLLVPHGKVRRVAGPLRVGIGETYYGFVPWLDSIAWIDAERGGLAGAD